MRVLILGAGAVGQVYGWALREAGAEVTFYMRPKYVEAARKGFVTYALNQPDRWTPRRLDGFGIVTTAHEVSQSRWDYVMPAVSGPALAGPWLAELLQAATDATVIMMHAGASGARETVSRAAPGRPMIFGLIPFMSYAAPLPGDPAPEPGTAWWLAPLSACPFEGPPELVDPLVDMLTKGGLKARRETNVAAGGAFGGAVLSSHMAAMEVGGWTFAGLSSDGLLPLAARATQEAVAVAARETGLTPPRFVGLVGPWSMRLVMVAAQWLTPHDVEAFFRVHFTKVRHQTRAHLDAWITRGEAEGLKVDALRSLRSRLPDA